MKIIKNKIIKFIVIGIIISCVYLFYNKEGMESKNSNIFFKLFQTDEITRDSNETEEEECNDSE